MGTAQSKNLMAEMKLYGMLTNFDRIINTANNDSWGNIEFIDALLQEEYDSRQAKKIESKIKNSKLKLKPELEDFDFTAGRSITKTQIKDLYNLDWVDKGRAILLIGPTGIGKTFIAQALGLHACRNGHSVTFMSVTNFLENIMLARSSSTYLKFRDKLIKPDLFILDDLGLRKFNAMEAQDLCEILEERSINKSTIITSQLPVENWHEVVPDPVIADAIIDRVIHSKIIIKIKGPSYRGIMSKKLEKNEKE